MSVTDPIADLLTRIRNSQRNFADTVISPSSRVRKRILEVLQQEGYIKKFKEVTVRPGVLELHIKLKYYDGKPVIRKITRISKPGCRIYSSIGRLQSVYNGLGIAILSTSQGIISDHEARMKNVGGEILCHVF